MESGAIDWAKFLPDGPLPDTGAKDYRVGQAWACGTTTGKWVFRVEDGDGGATVLASPRTDARVPYRTTMLGGGSGLTAVLIRDADGTWAKGYGPGGPLPSARAEATATRCSKMYTPELGEGSCGQSDGRAIRYCTEDCYRAERHTKPSIIAERATDGWRAGQRVVTTTGNGVKGEILEVHENGRIDIRTDDGRVVRWTVETIANCWARDDSRAVYTRDTAIKKWPWMAPFREAKVGDRFAVSGSSATVVSVDWMGGLLGLNGAVDGKWHMWEPSGWSLLSPYREAMPATNACKGAPCGHVIKEGESLPAGHESMTRTGFFSNGEHVRMLVCSESCRDRARVTGYPADDTLNEAAKSHARSEAVCASCKDPRCHRDIVDGHLFQCEQTKRPDAVPAAPWKCIRYGCATPFAPRFSRSTAGLADFCAVCADGELARHTADREPPRPSAPLATFTAPGGRHELARAGGWRAYR